MTARSLRQAVPHPCHTAAFGCLVNLVATMHDAAHDAEPI